MVKLIRIEYIQCNCGQGKLEEIARTNGHAHILSQTRHGNENVGPFWETSFYVCSHCGKIYQHGSTEDYSRDINHIALLMLPYEGQLTKEEIIAHAKEWRGEIPPFDEEQIISMRQK